MVIGNTIYSVVGQERLDAKNTSEKDRTFCKVRSFLLQFFNVGVVLYRNAIHCFVMLYRLDRQQKHRFAMLVGLKYCWRQGQPIASLVAMRLIRR